MAAHTPGPWAWHGDDNDLINPEMYARWVAGGYEEKDWPFVAQGDWHNDSKAGIHVSVDANADLIAAAPDLFDALKSCEEQLAAYHERGWLGDGWRPRIGLPDAIASARAAIAKAEGR